ncbi:MAG TPA: hypothetical protein VGD81_19130 [Opitutaceae bacterium]
MSVRLVFLAWALGFGAPEPTADSRGPTLTGLIASPAVREASGIAPSRRADHLLWTHNDSGGQPVIYAISDEGEPRGSLRLPGVRLVDWEDLASFEIDGQAYLLIADTGDGSSKGRSNCALYLVAEPDPATLMPGRELTADVVARLPMRFLDGPADCEAIAVDPAARTIYLLTKRTTPAKLYTLPLDLKPDRNFPAARPVARLTGIPQPTATQRLVPLPTSRYRAEPTALDFAPDGSAAVVLTYGDAWLFRRAPGQSWAAALAGRPEALPPHKLWQAEAACFTRDGRAIIVTSEGAGAPLLRYSFEPAP